MVSCAFCFWRSLFCLLVFVFKWYCSLLQKCTLPKIAVFSLMFQGFCSLQKCCNCLRVHRNDFARRSKFTTNHHFVKPAVEFYFCKCCCSQFSSSHMILFVTYNYLGGGGVTLERWEERRGDRWRITCNKGPQPVVHGQHLNPCTTRLPPFVLLML